MAGRYHRRGQDVLRVRYPAGSGTPSSSLRGGVQIVGQPRCLPATDVLLRFDFRTAANFDWTRGGKLGGGLSVGHGAAAGYRHSATAASARLTWGPDGFLHLYIYPMEGTQQDATYTDVARLGGGCGDSMFPGTLQVCWVRNAWNACKIVPPRAPSRSGCFLHSQLQRLWPPNAAGAKGGVEQRGDAGAPQHTWAGRRGGGAGSQWPVPLI